MRYMLLIYSDPEKYAAASPEEIDKIAAEYSTFGQSLAASGELLDGHPLEVTDTATTVRLEHGRPVPSDGPFAETKEWLCGFYLVDCADLDRAIELAGQVPGISRGSIEVRPVMVSPEEP
jgi:hypothetical protein